MSVDREQLEFLMSQALDGQLSTEDAERFERALADDPEARAEFERMKRLDDMVGQWGRRAAPIDEQRVGRLLTERIRDDAEFTISQALDGDGQAEQALVRHARRDPNLGLLEHQYRRMESMIRAWGSVEPPVDHERLLERLCETIHAEAARGSVQRPGRMFRLYAPLAAAASLVLVVGLWWAARPGAPQAVSGPAQIEIALVGPPPAAPQAKPVVEFSFGLAPDAPIQSLAKATEGCGIVISVGGFQGPRKRPVDGSSEVIF